MKRFFLAFFFVAVASVAHEELSEQVQIVTDKIKSNPQEASLYFERAELYRGDSHWSLAEKDYLQARKLSPEMTAVDLGLGLLYYDTKRFKESRTALDRFLAKNPNHSIALLTRGRVLQRMGNKSDAIRDYNRALQLHPDPAIYIERARLLADRREMALSGLEEGIAQLGPVVTLELYAIELELPLKRFDSALSRIDQIASQSERKESWLVRRAEILHLARRDSEAKETYLRALDTIDRLPEVRKGTRYTRDLRRKIELALEQLALHPVQ